MPDLVALISVTFSGLIAVIGAVLTYRSSREQRQHEQRLALEERVWETKSQGLMAVIAAAQTLQDSLDGREIRIKVAGLWSHHRRDRDLVATVVRVMALLDDLVPVVLTYASADCREAFQALRNLLIDAGAGAVTEEDAALIDKESLNLDTADARKCTERLIATARDSIAVPQ